MAELSIESLHEKEAVEDPELQYGNDWGKHVRSSPYPALLEESDNHTASIVGR